MIVFFSLLTKLLPLYFTMGMGYFLSQKAGNISAALALTQIYFIAPLIIALNALKLDFSWQILLLPFVYYLFSTVIGSVFYYFARKTNNEAFSIIGKGAGSANTGFLGIPVAMIIFPPEILPLYILAIIGGNLYESTFGYYFAARGKFTPKEAFIKLAKLPILYALIIGLVLGHFGFTVPEIWKGFERDLMGAYVIMGALIIGFGLGGIDWKKFDVQLISIFLSAKFIVWPLVVFIFVSADRLAFNILTPDMHKILLLMSCLPMAANTAAFAALFETKASQTALAVALSTLCGLVAIPLYITIFGLS